MRKFLKKKTYIVLVDNCMPANMTSPHCASDYSVLSNKTFCDKNEKRKQTNPKFKTRKAAHTYITNMTVLSTIAWYQLNRKT